MGPIPRALGPIPRALDPIPRALGPIPRTLGPIPRALGPIPVPNKPGLAANTGNPSTQEVKVKRAEEFEAILGYTWDSEVNLGYTRPCLKKGDVG